MPGANGRRDAAREVIIGHNWLNWLWGWGRCLFVFFRTFPRFSARRAMLAGDREPREAGGSPLGRAGRRRFMGPIYTIATHIVKEKESAGGWDGWTAG
jgi:hypothetical protein